MEKEGILEGILFVQGDEGITLESICKIMEINMDEAKSLLLSLKNHYEEKNRGLRIRFLGNAFKLTTKEELKLMNYEDYLQTILSENFLLKG